MYKTKLFRITTIAIIAIAATISSVHAQNRAYTGTDRQVQTLLGRIETQTDTFSREIDRSLDRSNIDGTSREDSITAMVSAFESSTDTLKSNFTTRRSSANDVREVLNRAVSINTFMQNNRVTALAQRQWVQLRGDLDLLASSYRVTTNWNTVPTNSGGSLNSVEIRTLIANIKSRSNAFRLSVGRVNRGNTRYTAAEIIQDLSRFDVALDDLNRSLTRRNGNNGRIQEVLAPASSINSLLASNRTNIDVTNKWSLLCTELTTLASYYRVSWNGDTIVTPGDEWGQNVGIDSRLTGSFRLNAGQSDNVANIVDRAITNANYRADQRDRLRRDLERRLKAPETLSFQKNGQQIRMSSANSATVEMTADGRDQAETSPNGRTVTTNVTATNRDLTISYEGDRINDYNVVFTPVGNRQLRVTRRIYLENQNQTLTVTSVYDKVSQTPDWNSAGNPSGTYIDGFAVPN